MFFVGEVIERKQSCHLNYSKELATDNFLSSRCQIRRGYVTAKHMYVCVSQNTRDWPSWKLSKLSSCEFTNVFEKEKKIVSLFFVKAKEKERQESF